MRGFFYAVNGYLADDSRTNAGFGDVGALHFLGRTSPQRVDRHSERNGKVA
jgi:hypothetical protein